MAKFIMAKFVLNGCGCNLVNSKLCLNHISEYIYRI